MEKIAASSKNRKILLRYTVGVVLAWTFVFVCLGLFNYFDSLDMVKLNAISQGRDTFNKDLVLRRWVASHGGVYVFPDQKTPPNPYLSHLPRRDIVTRDGQTLTLMNPAYVVRQVFDLGLDEFGLRGHITSLKPLNPKNAPDAWEIRALKDLARGVPEVVAETTIEGQPFLRLMRPLFVEKSCLKCHGIQGYKVGDLRGGTSVSIPMKQVLDHHQTHMLKILCVYFTLWSAGLLAIFIIFRNSNKRLLKSAEQRLYISRLSSLVEQTHSAVMIVGLDGAIEFVNHGYEQLSGYSEAEMLGCNALQLFATNEKEEQRADLWQTVNQGRRWRGIIASRHKNGTTVYEDAAAFPLRDDKGEIINFAVIKHDVTEARKLQQQLIQSQKMEAVGTLASGVAHDFNNILTVINGFSEILIDECEVDSPMRADLIEINEAGLRAADLTRQLLAFSRRQIIQPRETSLYKLIKNLMKMMRRLLSEDIELDFILPDETQSIRIMIDPGQIEQVLMNLLVNARDALKTVTRTKKIVLRLSRVELDYEFVNAHPGSRPGAFALIEVIDNGCGMTPEARQRCFEPFYTTKAVGQGTGMGLATVYGIIKQNSGAIYVDSKPGSGTTFRIYWPIIKNGDVAVKIEDKQIESSVKGSETILFAEDDDSIREIIGRKFQENGYQVISAANGLEALEKARSYAGNIDLLFTDVVMPLIGGKELSDVMLELYPEIKVIFVSGYLDDRIHKDILDKGFFINKPYSFKKVAALIRQLFEKQPA